MRPLVILLESIIKKISNIINCFRYAKKNNYPVLEHVTLPRIGAVKVITDSLYHEKQTNGYTKGNHIYFTFNIMLVTP